MTSPATSNLQTIIPPASADPLRVFVHGTKPVMFHMRRVGESQGSTAVEVTPFSIGPDGEDHTDQSAEPMTLTHPAELEVLAMLLGVKADF